MAMVFPIVIKIGWNVAQKITVEVNNYALRSDREIIKNKYLNSPGSMFNANTSSINTYGYAQTCKESKSTVYNCQGDTFFM